LKQVNTGLHSFDVVNVNKADVEADGETSILHHIGGYIIMRLSSVYHQFVDDTRLFFRIDSTNAQTLGSAAAQQL